jgi:hypothetical protein
MRRAFLQALLIFLLLLLPLAGLWWKSRAMAGKPADEAAPGGSAAEDSSPSLQPEEAMLPLPADARGREAGWTEALARAARGKDRAAGLVAIGNELSTMPRDAAVERLWAYLEAGEDHPTGLPWMLGPEGRLRTAPSLRVWLLDWLGRLDPEVAAGLARETFAAGPGGSSDEWALHLRNLAWGDPAAVAGLVDAALAMLDHPPWRADPSAGFQEAFDVFVWSGAAEVAGHLARLLPPDQDPRLRNAANLALDRLVEANPSSVLPLLHQDLGALDPQPLTRAGYFARADLGDPRQRELVEAYFLDPRLTAAERDHFLALVPNLNRSFSYNLLSSNLASERDAVLENLRQTVDLLRAWREDPRFRSWRRSIEAGLGRLEAAR